MTDFEVGFWVGAIIIGIIGYLKGYQDANDSLSKKVDFQRK